jgi:hypothetical protein
MSRERSSGGAAGRSRLELEVGARESGFGVLPALDLDIEEGKLLVPKSN